MASFTLPSVTDFLKKASQNAEHYGFVHLNQLQKDSRCKDCEKKNDVKILTSEKRIDSLHGILAQGASHYFENNLHAIGEPVLFYSIEETPKSNDIAFSLHIIGVEKSVAEMLLIQAIRSLFKDLAIKEHHIQINSLGDRESMGRYTRELNNYLRKRIESLPPSARELMKEHALFALTNLIEHEHEVGFKSPSSLEYLNESSRKHFREIIEYLDFIEAPYEIDARLLGHHQCYSQTLFNVTAYADETRDQKLPIRARGGRYSEFIFQHTKKTVPAVGAVILFNEKKLPARVPSYRQKTPQVFIVQIGMGPKLLSLKVLEELKDAQINVSQSLSSDSLTQQLEKARIQNVPYIIIIGQKEYMDGSIIMRDMRSSSQQNIPVGQVVPFLKRALHI